MVTKKELKDALIKLGLKKGMTLEVHSSLSSFGELEGGAMTVIDSLKELVSDQGSIFMPALRLSPELPLSEEDKKSGITVKIKVLPREEKRTAMGIIADTFRTLPGTVCGSDVISTAGWGAHAEEAMKGGLDWAIHNGGKALLLGVDIYKLTAMHYMEEITPKEIGEVFAPSDEVNKIYPPEEWFIECGHPPVKAWYKIQDLAYERGLIKEVMIGSCKALFFDILDVVSIYREELERDPFGLWGMKKMNETKNKILETERLFLREMTLEDTDTLALVLSDPESMKFYPHPFSREEVKNWIKWNLDNYKKYGFGLWAVCLKESGEMIGDCGITMQQVENDLFPEIGYHLRKEFRGKGYATEVAKACAEFAKKRGMKSIISYMKSDNLPSRHVAERNGMKFVKAFTKTVMGKLVVDEVLYMKDL